MTENEFARCVAADHLCNEYWWQFQQHGKPNRTIDSTIPVQQKIVFLGIRKSNRTLQSVTEDR
jgi:hypothetical protein